MSPITPSSSPRRILLIKPSAIGDVVHSLPVLALLRKRFPKAHIAWLVAPNCAALLHGNDDLDETILFDRRRFGRAWRSPSAALELVRFHRSLRSQSFDMAIDLQGLFRSAWLAWTTGAPIRVGFGNAREGAPLFYTHRVPIEEPEQHAIDRYLQVAAALGCDVAGPLSYRFPVNEADRAAIAALLADDGPFAVLLPGTNWLTKRWPAENFAAVVGPLRARFGLRCVVAGGADAAALARQIPEALNLTGQTSLPQLVALLERAALVIANDSGPMHIAAALGRPLVALFGPTNPVRTGPYRRMDSVVSNPIECSPCYSRHCSHISCLRLLPIEPVLAAAAQQLAGVRRHPLPLIGAIGRTALQ